MKLTKGTRVTINGYSDELWIEGYHVRVNSEGTIEEDEMAKNKKILVTIDDIDGDKNVCVLVKKSKLSIVA